MARVIDSAKKIVGADRDNPGEQVLSRVKRGRDDMRAGAGKRNQSVSFVRGEQYSYQLNNGQIFHTNVDEIDDGKVRQVRNLLIDIIEREVAQATQRVPSYQVTPSTTDAEDIDAARLSEKVALFEYEDANIKHITEQVVWWAVVGGDGFAWPYFDNTVGDYVSQADIYTGRVKVRYLGPNEVYWELGVDFLDSRWYCVEQAMPVDEVKAMPGFTGGDLKANAESSDVLNSKQKPQGNKLVLVTSYLERPAKSNKQRGRFLRLVDGKMIVPEEPYPLIDPKTKKVCDEPCLHQLGYFLDGASNRSMSLVEHLIDPQRTLNDTINKILDWKNLALNPQIMEPIGSILSPLTERAGDRIKYQPVGGQIPKWRDVPNIPPQLFQIAEQAEAHMLKIAGQNEIPAQIDSGKGVNAFIENDAARRQRFISNLAKFHSRLMRHILWLVQRHYSENRILLIRGRNGPERIANFIGADLLGNADVEVKPSSIEPRTKEAIYLRVMEFASRGWVTPEAAMAAINGGNAEQLVESYELDVSRAQERVRFIRTASEDQIANAAMMPNPNYNGTTVMVEETPEWMPQPYDNINVQMQVHTDWMKTSDFASLDRPRKQMAIEVYSGMKSILATQQVESQRAMAQAAQQMGMGNATRPAGPSGAPTPSAEAA